MSLDRDAEEQRLRIISDADFVEMKLNQVIGAILAPAFVLFVFFTEW